MTEPTRVDNTILGTVMSCTMKTVLRHIHGYTSLEESAHLKAGTAVHEALAIYFKGGTIKEALAVFKALYKEWAEANIDEADKYVGRLSYRNVRLIIKYWMEAHPMDCFPFTVEPEHVEVGFSFPLTKSGDLVLVGRLDAGPVNERNGGGLHVLDHKTTGFVNSFWLEQFRLSSQMTGYTWGLQQHVPQKIEGAIINAIQLSKLPGLDDPERKCRTPEHGKVSYEECQHLHVVSEVMITKRSAFKVKKWRWDAIEAGRKFQQMQIDYADLDDVSTAPQEGMFNGGCRFCEFKDFCMADANVENVGRMLKHEPWTPFDPDEVKEKAA